MALSHKLCLAKVHSERCASKVAEIRLHLSIGNDRPFGRNTKSVNLAAAGGGGAPAKANPVVGRPSSQRGWAPASCCDHPWPRRRHIREDGGQETQCQTVRLEGSIPNRSALTGTP